jgi:5'-methylthioadenosine phosphorylase
MHIDVGIIGGTGIGERLLALAERPVHIPTPYGLLRGKLLNVGGRSAMLISRHSAGHKVPPHKVNYRAMAAGLQCVGATVCFATAATGSLREDWPNGTMVACTDFLDLTGRNVTMHDRDVVHTDFSFPFGARGRKALAGAADAVGATLQQGVYLCGNGPRYETPREIQLYRQLGGDVVGMTAASEAVVMRETGIDYSCLAVVTNLAAGIAEQELSHEEVVEEMQRSGEKAVALLLEAVKRVDL